MLIAIAIAEKISGSVDVCIEFHTHSWCLWRIFGFLKTSSDFLIVMATSFFLCSESSQARTGESERIKDKRNGPEERRWQSWNLRRHRKLRNQRFFKENSMQSLVILRVFLQWRWQWASIGHFVFLFLKISLLEMLIAVGNEHLRIWANFPDLIFSCWTPTLRWFFSSDTHKVLK